MGRRKTARVPRKGTLLRSVYDLKREHWSRTRRGALAEFNPDLTELQEIIELVQRHERQRMAERFTPIIEGWITREADLQLQSDDVRSRSALRTLERCRRSVVRTIGSLS